MALMDDVLAQEAAHAVARMRNDSDLATARTRDAALFDNRMLQGFVTAELFRSDDPSFNAGLKASDRVPSGPAPAVPAT